LTEHGRASRDFAFRKQIRTSSSSAPSNIAEGFGYYKPKLFTRHLRIAIASLHETKGHLQDGAREEGLLRSDQSGQADSADGAGRSERRRGSFDISIRARETRQ